MIDVEAAARLLLEARRTGRPIAALPQRAHPTTTEEIYAIQDAQLRELGPIGGWKVGAPAADAEPKCAPLPASLVLRSPQRFAPDRFRLHLVEAELAFTFARDLPRRGAPYHERDVADAIASVHAAIEVLDSRYVDFKKVDAASQLADLQTNGALVVGPGRTNDVRVDQPNAHLQVFCDDRLALEQKGGNTAGDVFRLLVWLANHAGSRTGGLRAGQVVTTGSLIGAYAIAPGTRFRVSFPGIDSAEATV